MYKRDEDGIVLVDQDQCRGWRMCVTGCPYKKVYFNHKTGKAEKCTMCYPVWRLGSQPCVRRRASGACATSGCFFTTPTRSRPRQRSRTKDLMAAQKDLLLNPNDPEVIAAAQRDGIPATGSKPRSSRRSTSSHASTTWLCRCILSTARCRWFGTSHRCRLSSTHLVETGHDGEDIGNLFGAIDAMRIPWSTSRNCSRLAMWNRSTRCSASSPR